MTMKINYLAPEDHTGYGVAAAQYTRVLRSLGHDVAFQPLRPGGEPGLWYQCAPVGPLHSPRLHPDAESHPADHGRTDAGGADDQW